MAPLWLFDIRDRTADGHRWLQMTADQINVICVDRRESAVCHSGVAFGPSWPNLEALALPTSPEVISAAAEEKDEDDDQDDECHKV